MNQRVNRNRTLRGPGEENAQVTEPVEEGETTVGRSNEKQVAFLEEFARLQFGMGADQRAENLAQLGTFMSVRKPSKK